MKPRSEGSDVHTTPSVNDVLALCRKLREQAEATLRVLPGTEEQHTTRRFLSKICSNLPETEDRIPHAFHEIRCLLIGGKEREDSVLIRIGSNSSRGGASSSRLNPDLDLSNGAYKFSFIPQPGAGGKNVEWEVSEELLEKLRSGELRRGGTDTEEIEAETEQRATAETTTETASRPNDEQDALEDEAEAEEVEQVVRRKHNGPLSSDSSFSSTNESSNDIATRRHDKGKQRAICASSSLASVGEGSSTELAVRQYATIGVQTNAEGVVPTNNTAVEEDDGEYLALIASNDEDDDHDDAHDALIAQTNPLPPAPVPVAALPPPPHIHRPLRRENAMYLEPWPEPPAAGPVAVVAAQAVPAAAVAPAADIAPAPAAPAMALVVVPVVPAIVEAAPPPAAAPAPANHVPLEVVDEEEPQQVAGPSSLPNNAVASGSRRKQIEDAPAQPDTRRRSSRLSKRSTSNASAEASGSNVASGSGSRTRRKNNGKGKASDESLAPVVIAESSKAAGKRRRVEETIEEKDEEEAEGEGSAAPVASPKKRTRREAVAEPTKPPTRPRRNVPRRK